MNGAGQLSFLYSKKKKNTLKFDENGGGARVSAYIDWRLMDFWLQMFYQDNPPCSNLQRRLCTLLSPQFAF